MTQTRDKSMFDVYLQLILSRGKEKKSQIGLDDLQNVLLSYFDSCFLTRMKILYCAEQ
jgi:hypothetical protein